MEVISTLMRHDLIWAVRFRQANSLLEYEGSTFKVYQHVLCRDSKGAKERKESHRAHGPPGTSWPWQSVSKSATIGTSLIPDCAEILTSAILSRLQEVRGIPALWI